MANENTKMEMIRKGNILKEYTQTHFLTVSPLPAIEKVMFSIVKQGTKGKEEFLFFMDMEDFRLLCNDLNSATGKNKLKESMEHQYPDAFTYTGGTEGSRRLNIGGGKKGIRVQLQEKKGDAWDGNMVVVSYKSLRSMKFYFEIIMGLVPVSGYYGKLRDVFWNGYEEREKYRQNHSAEDGTVPEQETGKQTAGQDTPPQEQQASVYTVQTKGAVKKNGNTFYCPVTDSKNDYNLCFTPESLPAMGGKWEMFQERAADGVKIRISARIKGNRMEFVGIA